MNGIPFSAVVRRQKACATDDKPTRLMTSGFDRSESTMALAAATLVPQSYDLLRPMSSRPSRPTERNVCSHCHTELGKTPSLRATALRPSPLSNTSAAAGLTPGPYVLIDKPPIPRTLVFCPRNRRRFTPSQRVISYFHSIVKSCLQFVLVCRSLFQFVLFAPSLKNCSESMGPNLGHGFRGGVGCFRGSRWITASCEQQPMATWTPYVKGGKGREALQPP